MFRKGDDTQIIVNILESLIILLLINSLYKLLTLDAFLKAELDLTKNKRMIFKLNNKISYLKNHRPKLYFLNGSVFFIASCSLFVIGFLLAYLVLDLVIPSLVFGLIVSILPYILLEIFIQTSLHDIGKEITKLISTMTRWSVIKDDLYYCLEKSLDFVKGPLHYYLDEFLVTVRYTGHVDTAFDELLQKSNNESYVNFVMNIRQIEMSKGDLPFLLSRLEEEAFKIRGEQIRRDTSTALDRTLIYITGLTVLLLTVILLTSNQQFRDFYIGSTFGNYLLAMYAILYVLGFIYGKKINTFNY